MLSYSDISCNIPHKNNPEKIPLLFTVLRNPIEIAFPMGKNMHIRESLSLDLNQETLLMKHTPDSSRSRLVLTILEVALVLLAVRIAVEAFRSFTPLGRWEGGHYLNFSFGWFLLLAAYGIILLRRTAVGSVGLDVGKWKEEFNNTALWVGNKLHLRPPWVSWLFLMCLVACFLIGMLHYSAADLGKLFAWQLTATAIGEEVFFRGYVLGVVDQVAHKESNRSIFTWGVIVSSLLFGVLHLFNAYHFFGDKHDFAYFIALQTTITGFLFAVIREKSGSIIPGVCLHALLNLSAFTIMPEFTKWILGN